MFELGTIAVFEDIVASLRSGQIKEGTVLEKFSGGRAVVSENSLYWLTSGDYINAVVGMTEDVVSDVWKVVDTTVAKKISFAEGLDLLKNHVPVTFVSDGGLTFEPDSLFTLEIEALPIVTIEALYDGYCLVEETTEVPVTEVTEPEKVKESVGKKLTEEDVYNIHFYSDLCHQSADALAVQYGITTRMVYYILDGTYWKNVKERYEYGIK